MSLSSLDTLLFFFVNKTISLKILDPVMVFVTEKTYLVMLLILALIAIRGKKDAVAPIAVALAAMVLSDITSGILKELIRRPRPCDVLDGVSLLTVCPKSFSMPSGHAAGVFALSVPFYFLDKYRLKHALMGLSVLIALSRPYVGVHYPSDVFFGAALGSALGAGLSALFLKLRPRKKPE